MRIYADRLWTSRQVSHNGRRIFRAQSDFVHRKRIVFHTYGCHEDCRLTIWHLANSSCRPIDADVPSGFPCALSSGKRLVHPQDVCLLQVLHGDSKVEDVEACNWMYRFAFVGFSLSPCTAWSFDRTEPVQRMISIFWRVPLLRRC